MTGTVITSWQTPTPKSCVHTFCTFYINIMTHFLCIDHNLSVLIKVKTIYGNNTIDRPKQQHNQNYIYDTSKYKL